MDKLLEFDSRQNALDCITSINDEMFSKYESEGYTIIETAKGRAIVGKNALTGHDDYTALTYSWAEPIEKNGKYVVELPEEQKGFSYTEVAK